MLPLCNNTKMFHRLVSCNSGKLLQYHSWIQWALSQTFVKGECMARCLILYTRGNGTVALSGQTQCILQKHLHIEKCCKKDTKQWNKTQWKKEKQHKLRILKKNFWGDNNITGQLPKSQANSKLLIPVICIYNSIQINSVNSVRFSTK